VTCQELEGRLDPYVDGELDKDAAREVNAHLQGCPSCARLVASRQALRSAIRSQLPRYSAPDLLRSRVRSALRQHRPSSRSYRALGPWLAAAAALTLIVGGTWQIAMRQASGDRLGQDLIASHVRSLIPGHLIDVVSSDQHTVKPWFNGRIDFSPTVPDLADRGFPLVGGRLDYVAGHPVAVIVYTRRQHVINLFMWSTAGVSEAAGPGQRGYHLIHWTSSGTSHWAVSDLNQAELEEFVRLFRSEETH
jgi:anti-sigma factor (TIGR02949 family)